MRVDDRTYYIRRYADGVEYSIGRHLDRLERFNDRGWSPDTVQMNALASAVKTLRNLAMRIERLRGEMTKAA
jgi:hypothetical protein